MTPFLQSRVWGLGGSLGLGFKGCGIIGITLYGFGVWGVLGLRSRMNMVFWSFRWFLNLTATAAVTEVKVVHE